MKVKVKKSSILAAGVIDMTPITDTSFLLLIFFMITTVFKNPSQLKMVLPEALNPVKIEQVKMTVELDQNGQMAINGKAFLMDQFETYLAAEKQKTQSKNIVIRADQNAKHGEVLKLMKTAKAVGIESIALSVDDLTLKQEDAQKGKK
jgi:biopolymer transport protein ExbD